MIWGHNSALKTFHYLTSPNLYRSYLALPVYFKTRLQNLEWDAGEIAILRCEITKPGASVVWSRGDRVLESNNKYQLKQEGAIVKLIIYSLQGADSGEYICDTGYQKTSSMLTVQGREQDESLLLSSAILLNHSLSTHLLNHGTYLLIHSIPINHFPS